MNAMGERRQARRSIRFKGYDYRLAGGYFVTICVRNGECILGEIVDDEMVLNSFGQIVDGEWRKGEEIREHVLLDVYQVMPNHFHGIVFLLNELEPDPRQTEHSSVWAKHASPLRNVDLELGPFMGLKPGSLSAVIRGFKSASTRRVNKLRGISGVSIWQRNFWERIIRNERELEAIRRYILANPVNWRKDDLYPGSSRSRRRLG
jgi:REP element-mobilizing transposase RayT